MRVSEFVSVLFHMESVFQILVSTESSVSSVE